MKETEREIQDLLSQAQHLLHMAEVRAEKMMLSGARRYDLGEKLDTVQRLLVESQLSFVEDKEGEELLGAFFRGPAADQCQVEWNQEDRLLKIFIPDSWERVNTRPSIYIKDILTYRNANRVKTFYTKLLRAIVERASEDVAVLSFEKFEKCFAGFLFHFQDRYVRDPDNFLTKVLIDSAKAVGIFITDDYNHLAHFVGGICDQNRSGITLYFSDSESIFYHFQQDCDAIKNGQNHIRNTTKKPYSSCENTERIWF